VKHALSGRSFLNNMYKIALCEDEQIHSDKLEKDIRSILMGMDVEHEILAFASGAEFLDSFTKRNQFDLMFLDIMMKDGMDGVELARAIRQIDKDVAIIFITASKDLFHFQGGSEFRPVRFLLKPVNIGDLEEQIKEQFAQRFNKEIFVIKEGDKYHRVPVEDIVWLETASRRVKLTLKDETSIYYSGKLDDILEELPNKQIVQCHKSYAVNIDNIASLNYDNAIMEKGVRISVSRRYREGVLKAFTQSL